MVGTPFPSACLKVFVIRQPIRNHSCSPAHAHMPSSASHGSQPLRLIRSSFPESGHRNPFPPFLPELYVPEPFQTPHPQNRSVPSETGSLAALLRSWHPLAKAILPPGRRISAASRRRSRAIGARHPPAKAASHLILAS